MVKPFHVIQPQKIIFGNGKITELPALAKHFGNNILLVTGKSSFLHSKYGEFLLNTFDMTGVRFHQVTISREPSPEMIDLAVIRHREDNINLVIAIGGGSVVDAGKAISAMLFRNESVSVFLEGVGFQIHPGTKIPFIAVPTTSGTGSEVTMNAVISQVGKNGYKRSLRNDNFVPNIALTDPELTLNCPPHLTASSGMDCFTQLVESYLSQKSNFYTDALALEGLRILKKSLMRSWNWGQDLEAREGMSYAALLSGICLTNSGLGAVHGFASSLGGMYHIPHGIICGTLMGVVNKVTIRKLQTENNTNVALSKYAKLGKLFTDDSLKNDEYYIDRFIDLMEEWTEKFQLQGFEKFGMKKKDLPKIVSLTDCKSHPIQLSDDELYEILESTL